eukprot:TRINITY_DN2789_c0_g5_i1.p1 TRINITY_DN2789_c0_g5~~TRINITY_DN2789_c0_g5_i1.p1  ORF type:complete len:537 (+),score=142.66 TRINITY_DN2789_c0_g5_i1:222-1613(+)
MEGPGAGEQCWEGVGVCPRAATGKNGVSDFGEQGLQAMDDELVRGQDHDDGRGMKRKDRDLEIAEGGEKGTELERLELWPAADGDGVAAGSGRQGESEGRVCGDGREHGLHIPRVGDGGEASVRPVKRARKQANFGCRSSELAEAPSVTLLSTQEQKGSPLLMQSDDSAGWGHNGVGQESSVQGGAVEGHEQAATVQVEDGMGGRSGLSQYTGFDLARGVPWDDGCRQQDADAAHFESVGERTRHDGYEQQCTDPSEAGRADDDNGDGIYPCSFASCPIICKDEAAWYVHVAAHGEEGGERDEVAEAEAKSEVRTESSEDEGGKKAVGSLSDVSGACENGSVGVTASVALDGRPLLGNNAGAADCSLGAADMSGACLPLSDSIGGVSAATVAELGRGEGSQAGGMDQASEDEGRQSLGGAQQQSQGQTSVPGDGVAGSGVVGSTVGKAVKKRRRLDRSRLALL